MKPLWILSIYDISYNAVLTILLVYFDMFFVSQPSFIKDFYNLSSMLLILFIMFLLELQPSVFKDTFSTKQQIRGAL